MRISEPRYSRDRSRYDLAYRLLGYAVRPSTIKAWTGLSEYQIQTLSAGYPQHLDRQRGRAPCQVSSLLRSAGRRQHASILGGVCKAMGVLPKSACRRPEEFRTIARGWRLADAYQTYVDSVEAPQISFEHAALLAWELTHGENVKLGRCEGCAAVIVVDELSHERRQCAYCSERLSVSGSSAEEGKAASTVAFASPRSPAMSDRASPSPQMTEQGELF